MTKTTPGPLFESAPNDRSFLGHPVGLGYLAFTEAWERFSFYGMQTLLVLYMVKVLLLPGHVENVAHDKLLADARRIRSILRSLFCVVQTVFQKPP
jgi:hypothetical protein